MPQLRLRYLRQQRFQWLAVALALAVLGATFGYLALREHDQTLSRERDRLLKQASVIDENLSQQLLGINAALINMRDDVAMLLATGQESQMTNRLKALSDAMPGVRTMIVIDAAGKVIATSRPEVLGLDLSQRAYFQNAKAHPALDTLYVSEPFLSVLKVFSMNVVKIWTTENGQFAGIVVATLDPEYFDVLLRSVLYADDTRSTLIYGNSRVFTGMPSSNIAKGTSLSKAGSFFRLHRDSGRSESFFTGSTYATGDERIVAFRTTQPVDLHMDQPLVSSISRPLSAVLAPWRSLVELYALMYGLMAVFAVVATRMVQRRQYALMKLQAARDNEAREYSESLKLALAGGDLGSWDLNVETGTRVVNARAQEMVGLGPYDAVDDMSQWGARMHPDDLEPSLAARHAHEAGRSEAFVADYRVRHKDGHWVWIHSRGKVLARDDKGQAQRIVGTYQDVTERKTDEAQARRSAELLARLSRVSRTGGWDYDLKTGRSEWSPEMFRIRELDPSVELDQQSIMSAYVPESRVVLAAARAAAIEHQTPWDMELQMTTAKGNLIWVRTQGEAVVVDGKTVGLTGTLKNVNWRKQSQIDLQIANEKLERMALSDGLTGIANRRFFDQTLQTEWSRNSRSGQPLALLMIDIDHFKLYNDHYGHVGGDECLRRVAQVLAGCSRRASDLVCRYGGEEFAILLPGADLASASAVAQNCLDAIGREGVPHATSLVGPCLTLSIGVATAEADGSQAAVTLVERADAALYQAKLLGRARYHVVGELAELGGT